MRKLLYIFFPAYFESVAAGLFSFLLCGLVVFGVYFWVGWGFFGVFYFFFTHLNFMNKTLVSVGN